MTSTHAGFGAKTTATEVARVYGGEVRGRCFVITGVSPNSLGQAIATSLASQEPDLLILASRTREKLDAVVRLILSLFPALEGRVRSVLMDLSVRDSVRGAAREIEALVQREGERGVDVLFNNAGVNVGERKLTSDGVEMQFATNHLGPFLLTGLLLPLLVKGRGGRVVMTSSEAHRISPVRFGDLNLQPGKAVERGEEPRRGLPKGILRGSGYERAVAYGQSKTANVLMAVELNRRMGGTVKGFACMPGTIMTDFPRDMDAESLAALTVGAQWKDIDQGAATTLVAALDPLLNPGKGVYLDDCQVRKASRWAVDEGNAERLWRVSEEMVGERFEERGASRL